MLVVDILVREFMMFKKSYNIGNATSLLNYIKRLRKACSYIAMIKNF